MSLFTSRRRHTSFKCDWSSDVCSSDLANEEGDVELPIIRGLDHAPWLLALDETRPRIDLLGREVVHLAVAVVDDDLGGATVESRSEERRVGEECAERRRYEDENKDEG